MVDNQWQDLADPSRPIYSRQVNLSRAGQRYDFSIYVRGVQGVDHIGAI